MNSAFQKNLKDEKTNANDTNLDASKAELADAMNLLKKQIL